MTAAMPWFDPGALIWLGPTLGVLEALWGGVIGLLSHALVRKGRGRGVVYGHLYAGLAVAIAFLTAGAAARASGQPPAIYATLLAGGGPLLVAAALSLVSVARAYRLIELHRMAALDSQRL